MFIWQIFSFVDDYLCLTLWTVQIRGRTHCCSTRDSFGVFLVFVLKVIIKKTFWWQSQAE